MWLLMSSCQIDDACRPCHKCVLFSTMPHERPSTPPNGGKGARAAPPNHASRYDRRGFLRSNQAMGVAKPSSPTPHFPSMASYSKISSVRFSPPSQHATINANGLLSQQSSSLISTAIGQALVQILATPLARGAVDETVWGGLMLNRVRKMGCIAAKASVADGSGVAGLRSTSTAQGNARLRSRDVRRARSRRLHTTEGRAVASCGSSDRASSGMTASA